MPVPSFTAIPTRSVSGSQPITKSAPVASAWATAMARAALSSGLGLATVGKLPSGVLCASTSCTLVKPAFTKAGGTLTIEVPCNAVKTMFKSVLPALFKDNPAIISVYFSSSSVPTFSISASFASQRISSNLVARTCSMTPLSCGGTNWPPSFQYTLYPLYSLGLCEAVKTIPKSQPNSRTAKLSSGVGRNSSNK